MATEHASLTDPELHEPKGVAAASSGQLYVANGAGSGAWSYLPYGGLHYNNVGTGLTFTAPTSYTLINPTTTLVGTAKEFTQNSAGRLTYTGSETLDFRVHFDATIKHSSASSVAVFFQIYKNGVAIGHENVMAAASGAYRTISFESFIELTYNDYVEVYLKTASGNAIVHSLTLNAEGKL